MGRSHRGICRDGKTTKRRRCVYPLLFRVFVSLLEGYKENTVGVPSLSRSANPSSARPRPTAGPKSRSSARGSRALMCRNTQEFCQPTCEKLFAKIGGSSIYRAISCRRCNAEPNSSGHFSRCIDEKKIEKIGTQIQESLGCDLTRPWG